MAIILNTCNKYLFCIQLPIALNCISIFYLIIHYFSLFGNLFDESPLFKGWIYDGDRSTHKLELKLRRKVSTRRDLCVCRHFLICIHFRRRTVAKRSGTRWLLMFLICLAFVIVVVYVQD